VQQGNVAPVSALAVDEGRTSDRDGSPRVSDPALAAGTQLARLLGVRPVARGVAPEGATPLATVTSAPLAVLVEEMLTHSDNDLAEALGRQVALATKLPATFEGVAEAIAAALKGLGVEIGLRDASGLSPLNRLRPDAVTTLLAKAAQDARYAPVLSGLPVAGFDGTLSERYRTGPSRPAAGEVRAKTGTLNGVSALAGLVVTRDGRLLAFDLTADGVAIGATASAQKALDRVATALAACGCP
jgi:D-alanyl-D-alanine carboxypeptidase/D-alanyl-D-alanine-endopeptidase (penicillin-binding protein 4)